MVNKTKAIYHTLNFFSMDVVKKFMIGECWVPCADVPTVQKVLTDASVSTKSNCNTGDYSSYSYSFQTACGSSIPSFLNVISSEEDPPTFYRTNKFTKGFQIIIDAYGVASYREVNPGKLRQKKCIVTFCHALIPGVFTMVTFPFLFAVMFGDCGHAIIMMLFALWMILSEKKLEARKKNEIFSIFFGGRYIILLMGLFSFYTGLLYNDMFSISLNIFQSRWFVNASMFDPNATEQELLPKANYHGTPYFMGIDPVWQVGQC